MEPDVVVAGLTAVPATVLAAAAWRAASNAPKKVRKTAETVAEQLVLENGTTLSSLEDLKKLVWYTNEEIGKMKWFLMEHMNEHGASGRRVRNIGRVPERRRA